MRSRRLAVALLALIVIAGLSCAKKSRPRAGGGSSDPSAAAPAAGAGGGTSGGTVSSTPFLQGTRDVPARMEWNRDFGSKSGGVVSLRVTSTAPFGVTVVTDQAYRAVKNGAQKVDRSQGLLSIDAKPPSYEGRVTVPPGMAWIIIENQSDSTATIHLECFQVR